MKKVYILVMICLTQIIIAPVLAQDILTESSYRVLIVERLDLYQDASSGMIIENITVEMDYLASLIVSLDWVSISLNWGDFGSGNDSGVLINGTGPVTDGIVSPFIIKSTYDWLEFTHQVEIFSDEKVPNGRHLNVEYNFYSYLPYGIKMSDGHTFGWQINDNILDYCDDFSILAIGWKMINLEPDFERDWLEEVFKLDDLADYFVLPVVLPLAMIFTWDFSIVLLGIGIALFELIIIRGIWVKIRD